MLETRKIRKIGLIRKIRSADMAERILTAEGVADAADFDFDVLEGGAGFEGVSAGATDLGEIVLGMEFFFHGFLVSSQWSVVSGQ